MVSRAYRIAVALGLAIVLALIIVTRAPQQAYESLAPAAANLRAQFNADAGRVRMLILPAPT